MNAAVERLRQGDLSSLYYVLDAVELAGMHAPEQDGRSGISGPLPSDVIRVILGVLTKEGESLLKQMTRTTDQSGTVTILFATLPSDDAVTAMRILLAAGGLNGTRGELTRQEIRQLGVRKCRSFVLDAYFRLSRDKQYYVVHFVNLLAEVLRCSLSDLLRNERNIRLTANSVVHVSPRDEVGGHTPVSLQVAAATSRGNGGGSGGDTRAAGASSTASPSVARHVSSPGRTSTPATTTSHPTVTAATRAVSTLPPPHSAPMVASSRRARDGERPSRHRTTPPPTLSTSLPSVPVLTSTEVSLSGASRSRAGRSPLPPATVTQPGIGASANTASRYRGGVAGHGALNRHEATLVPINGASADLLVSGVANPARRFRNLPKTASSTPFGQNPLYDADAPIAENVLLTAQFPTPVVLFSRLHGLGCLPKLPTSRQYHTVLEQLASRTCTTRAPLRPNDGSQLNTSSRSGTTPQNASGASEPPTPGGDGRRGSDSSTTNRISADRRMSMHAAADDPDYYVFPTDVSEPAQAYHRLCRDHWLLSRYLEDGVLMGWGCTVHGALGTATSPSALPVDGTTRTLHPGVELKAATPATLYQFSPTTARCSHGKVVQVACGGQTTFVVSSSGGLYSCGRCESGQLGLGERCLKYQADGCPHFRRIYVKDGERVVRVEAGAVNGAAVTENSFIYLWGHNKYGQCMKQPDAIRVLNPVRFRTGHIKACDIGCGLTYGCLVFADGAMGTWGYSRLLGRTLPPEQLQPTLAQDGSLCQRRLCPLRLDSGCAVAAVATGLWHAAVVTKMGQLLTWGAGSYGRLGHNADSDEVAPRLVEALKPVFVVAAACGSEHTAVVTSAGEVYVFGDNAHGQLGVRGRRPRRSPVQLPLPSPALAVSCGSQHTCVLLQSGDVVACGALRVVGCGLGYSGAGGAVVRILQNYITLSVSCGSTHTMAIALPRSTALCRLGHSTIEELSRMESVLVRHGVRSVASGVGFLLILSESGKLLALGRGESGQTGLGDGMKPRVPGEVTVVSSFQRVTLPDDSVTVEHVCCGPDYVLALDGAGVVYGWGNNATGQLGMNPTTTACVYKPVKLTCYTGRVITQLACGGTFVVALTEDSEVLTHGARAYCGLGAAACEDDDPASPDSAEAPAGTTSSSYIWVPTEINSLRGVTAIAAGSEHAAALTVSGLVYVWGRGILGTAPGASTVVAHVPTKVLLSCTVRQLGCGPRNTFVISDEGELYVWGCNKHRQCGTRSDPLTPSTAPVSPTSKTGGHSGVVAIPTRVLYGVRDAAFTSRFCTAALESGEVRVAGRLRHQGVDLKLAGFNVDPQPRLSVTLNSRTRRSSFKTQAQRSGSASAASATAAGDKSTDQKNKLFDALFSKEEPSTSETDDEGDDEHAMMSSRGSGSLERGGTSGMSPTPGVPERRERGRRGRHRTHISPFDSVGDDIILTGVLTDAHTGSGGATATSMRGAAMDSPSLSRPSTQRRLSDHQAISPHAVPQGVLIRRTQEAELDLSVAEAARTHPELDPPVSQPPLTATLVTKDGTAPVENGPASCAMTKRRSSTGGAKGTGSNSGGTTEASPYALRVFGGWEQIFTVVETDRPDPRDVQRAHRGLHVYISASP